MQRKPVTSSNVRSVGYDPASKRLHVEFNGKDARMPGRVYEYTGVPPEEHEALMSSQSIGSHFAQRIKPKYTGRVVSS